MALAASTGSPSMKAIAVGPLSSGARSEKPTESAARFVRVFLTTAYVLPAPRERRSSVSCATVSPRYSVSTAALDFWNRSVISSITAAFACVGMGLLSSVGRPPATCARSDQGPETRNAPAQSARGERRAGSWAGAGPRRVRRTVHLRGSSGDPDLRSHADVRRPAVLGGTAARVHAGGRRTAPPPEGRRRS